MFKSIKKQVFGLFMAMVMAISLSVPAFAAETPSVSPDIGVTSGDMQIVEVTDEGIQTRGSLSGYRCVEAIGSGTGFFVVDVSGSWSPWAGCTLKTSNFSSDATIEITVRYGDEVKFTKTLGPNTEVRNIAMLNVSPGGYTVDVKIENNSNRGTIEAWFY